MKGAGVTSQETQPHPPPLPVCWAWSLRWAQALYLVNHAVRTTQREACQFPGVTCISSYSTCPLQSSVTTSLSFCHHLPWFFRCKSS